MHVKTLRSYHRHKLLHQQAGRRWGPVVLSSHNNQSALADTLVVVVVQEATELEEQVHKVVRAELEEEGGYTSVTQGILPTMDELPGRRTSLAVCRWTETGTLWARVAVTRRAAHTGS
jgi:hypothetical protein